MTDLCFSLQNAIYVNDEAQNFEGPLSLILILLSKNKIEIRDIKIADILEQYLAYLEKMQTLDLEVSSEFVQMASHLLLIKTKMLLSSEETVSELEELMQSLERLKARDTLAALLTVVPVMKAMSRRGLMYHTKPPEVLTRDINKDYSYSHSPVQLLQSLYKLFLFNGGPDEDNFFLPSIPRPITYSIKLKSRQIIELLAERELSLKQCYSICNSKSELIATFISILELCNAEILMLSEKDDDLFISFLGGDSEEIIELMEG